MNKSVNPRPKYSIQWETHANNVFRGFCSLMERQSLVDVLICCGNNTLLAHKCVLAAHSPLFREEFEKNLQIEQVVINGCEFAVLKCVVEIMYCGQSVIYEHQVNYLIALIKLLGIKSLDNLFLGQERGEEIVLPKPQFLTKKPKFPTYPFNAIQNIIQPNKRNIPIPSQILKPIMNFEPETNINPFLAKGKLRLQAEQACVKEAQASKMALATLQKEIATAPQDSSFIIEESCTETTVENFIPDSEQSNLVQIVNYSGMENASSSIDNSTSFVNATNDIIEKSNSNIGTGASDGLLTTDKIKHFLDTEMPSNVEIMYKTSDGNFVPVTPEVLQNLSTKEGLQYQVIDENGHIGELQELIVLGREKLSPKSFSHKVTPAGIFLNEPPRDHQMSDEVLLPPTVRMDHDYIGTSGKSCDKKEFQQIELDETVCSNENVITFSPDIFFADISKVENDLEIKENDVEVETSEAKDLKQKYLDVQLT